MFKSILRLMLILVCVWSIPIAIIRAQPYDDSELRAFLTPPEDCAAPCFMGIQPFVTTAEEAIKILQAHEWVTELDTQYYRPDERWGSSLLQWRWSGSQPAIINARGPGTIELQASDSASTQFVSTISFSTQLTLEELMFTIGQPVSSWLVYDSVGAGTGIHTAVFDKPYLLQINTIIECPLNIQILARQRIYRLSIGRDYGYVSEYFLQGPFPHYLARELARFPGC